MFTVERLYDTLETGKLGLEVRLSDRRVELADLEMVTRCVDDLRSLLEAEKASNVNAPKLQ